mmetsp:Transcript_1519/g.3456  ORF Transcript_1519/g.3456 Transcript_1519/m.3456 type:complete len:218 (+) Transcript_1519:2032-2685(+)
MRMMPLRWDHAALRLLLHRQHALRAEQLRHARELLVDERHRLRRQPTQMHLHCLAHEDHFARGGSGGSGGAVGSAVAVGEANEARHRLRSVGCVLWGEAAANDPLRRDLAEAAHRVNELPVRGVERHAKQRDDVLLHARAGGPEGRRMRGVCRHVHGCSSPHGHRLHLGHVWRDASAVIVHARRRGDEHLRAAMAAVCGARGWRRGGVKGNSRVDFF